MPHITSTLTNPVEYTLYRKTAGGLMVPVEKVLIEGGANVASKHFVTPEGVVTQVTDKQLELLEANEVFRLHRDGGFLKVHRSDKVDVAGLTAKDDSAPITPKDYVKRGKKAPKTVKE